MANTLQTTLNYVAQFIYGQAISSQTGNEPAISIASMIRNSFLGAPMTWAFNRAEDSSQSTTAGTQDYTYTIATFGFLEKVSLTDAGGKIWEVKDIYNSLPLSKTGSIAAQQQRPSAVAVIAFTPGTSFKIRFMGAPDAIYTINLTYQTAPVQFAALSDGWAPIPDSYSDIYNNLFLGEAFAVVDDARAQIYRQRGVAAFLAKAEGLTDTQKNIFAQQWLAASKEQASAMLKSQQAVQARGI